ncbi:MAG: 23S rRNA (adenine(2503)-C(2))-methyltransferase RlmN [Chlamydiales bacterium]|nr:23S rRNA (adenine(2503)-C(2))-methyltransferase RlmN [Chlamydiales bacterium]
MMDFFTIELTDLRRWMQENGYQPFQAEQIFDWVYEKGATDWGSMTNLGAPIREALAKAFRLATLKPKQHRESPDGVQKVTWALVDGSLTDTVLTPSRQGWHLTMSTQVGCPVGCAFCASGKRFVRNLQPAEVFEQFLRARQWVREQGTKEIITVGLDGMGEPLKHVKGLLAVLDGFIRVGFSPNKITIPTIGLIEGIEQLLQLKVRLNLKVGLHAPTQILRQKLVPYAKKNRLEALMTVCRRYSMQTGLPVTFDYVMIAGVNDHPDQALELAHLLKHLRCQVRLIPYNPVQGFRWQTPDKRAIKAFRTVLFGSKIPNSLIEDPGVAISAGLGQLAPRTNTER